MAYLRRVQTMYDPLPEADESNMPETRLPGGEVGRVRPHRREKRRRQVNVKLRIEEGESLDRAARMFGVPPATLARMLVNRGVQSVLEEYGG